MQFGHSTNVCFGTPPEAHFSMWEQTTEYIHIRSLPRVISYHCIAFERRPGCVEYMCRVNAINSFRDFTVEQCAVGEDRADLEVFVSDLTWYSSFNRSHVEGYEAARPIRVNSVSLYTYCLSHEVAPTVIKIDILKYLPGTSHKDRLWARFHFLGYVACTGRSRVARPLRQIRSEGEFLKATEMDFIFVANREL